MTLSLDTAFTATCLQVLEGLSAVVEKADAHCTEQGLPAQSLTEARLAPDMWPFAKQVLEATRHSAGAIAAVRKGVFSPDPSPPPTDFAALRGILSQALADLRAVTPGELDAIAGRDMRFEAGSFRLDFTVEDFLLSLSLPNVFFHVTTAYAILRQQGLNIGKRDYLGPVRLKQA